MTDASSVSSAVVTWLGLDQYRSQSQSHQRHPATRTSSREIGKWRCDHTQVQSHIIWTSNFLVTETPMTIKINNLIVCCLWHALHHSQSKFQFIFVYFRRGIKWVIIINLIASKVHMNLTVHINTISLSSYKVSTAAAFISRITQLCPRV